MSKKQDNAPYDEGDLTVVHYSRRLVVPVPLDETFAYLSRFSSAAEWDPGVTSARMVTPNPVQLGRASCRERVFAVV